MLKALIFDVDGTLADTEEAHRAAFNAAFRENGSTWNWSTALYTELLAVSGGKERIFRYWQQVDPAGAAMADAGATVAALHACKTRHYERLAGSGQLPLRPGILRLIREAGQARLPLAIATTTTSANIDALLRAPLGRDWRSLFSAVCDAGSAENKKPAPDVYHVALTELGLPAAECLAFEDSVNGVYAALTAGIPTLVTPTAYTRGQRFDGALLCLAHLGDPDYPLDQPLPGTRQRWVDLAALRRLHAMTTQPEELT
jgi:beta-phosphoglucomutase-like phosphatase (HAD superfamily)